MITKALLQPVEAMLNRSLGQSSTAVALCSALDGRVINLSVEGLALDCYLSAADECLTITPGRADTADATISGGISGMLKLLGDDPAAVLKSGAVQLSGDIEIATRFSELLYQARPDLEEELSHWVGDAAAFRIGDFMRLFADQSRKTRSVFEQQFGEFLHKGGEKTPTRAEAEAFYEEVDELSNAVARAEARLNQLKAEKRAK